ncbi:MAG: TonB-dependent receptor [Acidobacteriota bacterium]|nr:MAG: TonB-dependent receptor [Acidobacteriota bacterium]
MRRLFAIFLFMFVVAFAFFPLAFGQGERGAITGVVSDESGAVIPGVEVTILNQATGVARTVVTSETGVYRAPYLPPATYGVTAALSGFKSAVAENVLVRVAQTVTVDFTLELGELTETITISSQAPLLETSSSEIGADTTELEFHTWPIFISDGQRQLQNFIFTSMPGVEGSTFEGSIDGGQAYTHEILIDGISLGRFDLTGGSNNEFSPSVDATSQFSLQKGNLSAQYGGTQTSVANFVMKSGVNDYHGTVYWFHQSEALRANSWSENRTGANKQPFTDDSFGGTFGGPIIKDRTHFFFSFEGEDFSDRSVSGTVSLPSEPFKRGDFSLLFDPAFTQDPQSGSVVGQDALGRDVIYGQIYDPTSARQLADGSWILDPFVGNQIPTSAYSSISSAILAQADTPAPDFDNILRRNTRRIGRPVREIRTFSVKIDHSINDAHKLSGFYMSEQRSRTNGPSSGRYLPWPAPASSSWQWQQTPGKIFRLSEDWAISPTLLNHFAMGVNGFVNKNKSHVFGEDWASNIGLEGVGQTNFPIINFNGRNSTFTGDYSRLGSGNSGQEANRSFIFTDDLSWMKGSHSLRVGFEVRRYHQNYQDVMDAGSFAFDQRATSLPGQYSSVTGFAYASFLMGAADTAGLYLPLVSPGARVWYNALYVQDDWKVRPNFTVNLGFRWDFPGPFKEVNGKLSGLDLTAPNPDAGGIPGALVFLSKGQSFQDPYYWNMAPRVGFAWNPTEKLVLRGGYGLSYSPPIANGWDMDLHQGFNGSENIRRGSAEFSEGPALWWDNGFPPYDLSVYPNYDPSQMNGSSAQYLAADSLRMPYSQNWHVGIQYELPWETVLETNYIGSKGTRLEDGLFAGNQNQMPLEYLALGNALFDDINDHPELPNNSSPEMGWVPVYQAVKPFPQYYSVRNPHFLGATSIYNSLQVTATRRAASGLSFLASYTFSKAIGSSDAPGLGLYSYQGQDFYNRKNERSLTSFHRPHSLKLTWMYDLPFGEGQRWGSDQGWVNAIIGGWTISAIHQYRSGDPLSIVAGNYHWNDWYIGSPSGGWRGDVLLGGDSQTLGLPSSPDGSNGSQYLNPAAFGSPPGTDGWIPLRVGTAPRHLPNVRGPALFSEDVSIIKRTALPWREGMSFEFRADIMNFFNRAGMGNPSTNIDSSDFGKIWGNRWGPRTFQLGVRFNF